MYRGPRKESARHSLNKLLIIRRYPGPTQRRVGRAFITLTRGFLGTLHADFCLKAKDVCLKGTLQGCLAHKKTPTPLGTPWEPRHGPTVGSYGGAFSNERGTPVHADFCLNAKDFYLKAKAITGP